MAFAIHGPGEILGTDEYMLYRTTGHERIDITSTHPVQSSYQNGLCLYCEEPLADELIHVNQIIPHTLLNYDEIWNLVVINPRFDESCSEG